MINGRITSLTALARVLAFPLGEAAIDGIGIEVTTFPEAVGLVVKSGSVEAHVYAAIGDVLTVLNDAVSGRQLEGEVEIVNDDLFFIVDTV